MSKVIRIENADTSDFKVTVEIWDKGQNGKPDVKREGFCPLHFPTSMVEIVIHKDCYLVVKEDD